MADTFNYKAHNITVNHAGSFIVLNKPFPSLAAARKAIDKYLSDKASAKTINLPVVILDHDYKVSKHVITEIDRVRLEVVLPRVQGYRPNNVLPFSDANSKLLTDLAKAKKEFERLNALADAREVPVYLSGYKRTYGEAVDFLLDSYKLAKAGKA